MSENINGRNGGGMRKIQVTLPITVKEFADALAIKPFELVHELMELNIFSAINHSLDVPVLRQIGAKHHVEVEVTDPGRRR